MTDLLPKIEAFAANARAVLKDLPATPAARCDALDALRNDVEDLDDAIQGELDHLWRTMDDDERGAAIMAASDRTRADGL